MLLFVYNADAGKLNAAMDIAHKLISPSTYRCSLCRVTHGLLKEKAAWTAFKNAAAADLKFYHKDEFEQRFERTFDYPVVLEKGAHGIAVVLTKHEIDQISDVDVLIKRLKTHLMKCPLHANNRTNSR